MKRFRRFVMASWQPLLLYSLAAATLAAILCYRLGALPAHLSSAETTYYHSISSWHDLLNNPLYAPHKIVILCLRSAGLKSLLALRAVSVGWAVLIILLFFSVLRKWFTTRIALLGTLLLASSTWLLIAARSVTPEIMQASLVALLAIGGWLRYSRARVLPLLIGVALTALLCYIPGMIWFVILGALWQRHALKETLQETSGLVISLVILLAIILLAPLLYALVRQPDLLRTLLGLPNQFANWAQLARSALDVPAAFFVRAPTDPAHWVGHVPLLDIFSAAMFVLGLYSFFYGRLLDRAKILFGLGLFVTLLITLGGGITLTMLLPGVYIVITAGINLMLQQWLTVFPRNPLARWIGASILVVAVFVTSFYQLNRYYQAWQHAPSTKQIYSQTI